MGLKENFSQIQKILNVISTDEGMSKQFGSLDSVQKKFDFAKDKCEEASMLCDYNVEEFEKFLLFTDLMHQISEDEHFSDKFKETFDINEFYDILTEKAKKNGLSTQMTKFDFESFIHSFGGKTEKIPPDELGTVAGGLDFKSLFSDTKSEYEMGVHIGEKLKKFVDTVSGKDKGDSKQTDGKDKK